MTPADIAAEVLAPGNGAQLSIEPIKHGLTNESWLVRTSADSIVVRISNRAEDALRIDRASEAAILAAVAAAGIGPEVLLCDPARHVLVTRYLGATWTDADAAQEANIRRLAAVLRRLHGHGLPDGIRQVDLLSTIDGYLRTLAEHGTHPDLRSDQLRERSRALALTLGGEEGAVLCHNDVHALNIVDAGALRLLDWEYAGAGSRWFDLAAVCVYHQYDEARRAQLLDGYFLQPESSSWARLDAACWLFEYIRELWSAVRVLQEIE
jgi:thiamine kinase